MSVVDVFLVGTIKTH